MVSQNESETSYNSRVKSRVKVVWTSLGTCLIGKESEMSWRHLAVVNITCKDLTVWTSMAIAAHLVSF